MRLYQRLKEPNAWSANLHPLTHTHTPSLHPSLHPQVLSTIRQRSGEIAPLEQALESWVPVEQGAADDTTEKEEARDDAVVASGLHAPMHP
jgi:hypothetical protein